MRTQDLAINLIFAGYDTCASSIHFLLRELHFNPQCMRMLREEQQQARSLPLLRMHILHSSKSSLCCSQ